MLAPKMYSTLGIIGYPISHSISPIFQQSAIDFYGLPDIYKPYEIAPDQLGQFMSDLKNTDAKGINVTVPHKQAVIPYLDSIDEWAVKAGAVNTIVKSGSKLLGYNTDGYGFIEGLKRSCDVSLFDCNVLIFGAGGSARAVLLSLIDASVNSICIANRTLSKAVELREIARNNGITCEAVSIEDKEFKTLVGKANIIVNCTTIGMKNDIGVLPFGSEELHRETIVYDLVYNPIQTSMITEGEKSGCKIISGIDMLVFQGAKSFEFWFKKQAPIEVMLKSAKSAIL
ncbi:MAG TPA: shikimate dehydrogenase [Dehalococcoidia bacterium]|jgi:shikimate dehydrogenase|nr:shikimate dehydrogenase [Dehalococcoidia bacterium]|tara:strand:+ start:597 stop:1451 length:855 start_codon:yes stop_codon:yes gene_type:complete